MSLYRDAVRWLLEASGVELGAVALAPVVTLLVLALHIRHLQHAGRYATLRAGRTAAGLKITVITLVVLAVMGVISINLSRGVHWFEVGGRMLGRVDWMGLFRSVAWVEVAS